MLKLTHQNIKLEKRASNKSAAIEHVAADLAQAGLVDQEYVTGMLAREAQNSTFLGNGIAIPHGTTDTRHLVNKTGVIVHHYPQGVNWGDDNTVYVAIGIAAKSDEHLGILKQLTKVLSADGVEEKLKQAQSANDIIALLNGDVQLEADFNAAMIQTAFPASDMVQLSAIAGALLKTSGCTTADYVANLITQQPTNLGHGLWLISASENVQRTGLSFVSVANEFVHNGESVKALFAVAANSGCHQPLLNVIAQHVFEQKQKNLIEANPEQLIGLLKGEVVSEAGEQDNCAVFKIKNAHGLHARPGAMLVAEAKKFESDIRVANLDGDGKMVNAKSLMKVIAMGVKHGHQLKFVADGHDAERAIESIGAAINAGLGEA